MGADGVLMKTPEQLYEEFMERAGDEMAFEVTRAPERVINRNNTTFSKEGTDFLFTQMTAFIGSRIMRRWKEDGKGPVKMRVTVKVEMETETSEYQR